MSNKFREEIRYQFDFLSERGYEVVSHEVSMRSFGNEIVTYRSPSLTVRVVRDRGFVWWDAGPVDGAEFYGADIIRCLIGGTDYKLPDATAPTAAYSPCFLGTNLKEITHLFFPSRLAETRERIRVLYEQRNCVRGR